jgi:hypothetical protein
MKSNQKGFSTLEILMVVLVIGLLGAIGWLVYDRQDNKTTQPSQQEQKQETAKAPGGNTKIFDCKGEFSVKYPEPLQASMIAVDPSQCLISNVKTEEMPPVGPLPPEQLGLFFNTDETTQTTGTGYLNDYIELAKQGYSLTLKGQEEIALDNGKTAALATLYGGHPVPHDFYFFVHIKNGKAITTSFPVNTNHKDLTLTVLKSIQ